MPHELMAEHGPDGEERTPVLVTVRYQCQCVGREVLTVQTVLDLNIHERALHWTIDRMLADIRTEVAQHVKGNA